MRQVAQSASVNCDGALGAPWQASRLPNSAPKARSTALVPVATTGSAQGMYLVGSGWVKLHFMKFGELESMVSSKGMEVATPVAGSTLVTCWNRNVVGPPYLFMIQNPLPTWFPLSPRGAASMYARATIIGRFIMKRVVVTVSVNGGPSSTRASTVRAKLSCTADSIRCCSVLLTWALASFGWSSRSVLTNWVGWNERVQKSSILSRYWGVAIRASISGRMAAAPPLAACSSASV